jgi:hypothetical protein
MRTVKTVKKRVHPSFKRERRVETVFEKKGSVSQ